MGALSQADTAVALGLFLVALVPRLLALTKFITADEPRWVIRSMSFLTALLTTDWQSTLQTGHPGVTTMWSGSLGLTLDYLINNRSGETLLAFVQSLPDNYQRIDPTVLPWMRLPTVFLTALSVVAVFWFLRALDKHVAIVAALLLAFHPLHVAHSQLLHHDALVSVFASFAIFLILKSLYHWSWTVWILSGLMTGLAILSKSTAYALLPFAGLTMLLEVFNQRQPLKKAVLAGLVWGGVALVTVFLLWPALWVAPLQVWQTIVGWIDQSADVGNVSNSILPQFGDGVPNLGLLFYPINWLLKTTPLMIIGLLMVVVRWRDGSWPEGSPDSSQMTGTAPAIKNASRWWTTRFLLWIGIFSLMLILGDKRDGRYLLPIYFALCILAAFGLKTVYDKLIIRLPLTLNSGFIRTNLYHVAFVLLLLGFSLSYYPYYLSYYNPLVGGPWLATRLIRVGWGDGMEEAAAWLNQQPNAANLRVATIIEQSFWPYFAGHIATPDSNDPFSADYVLNYNRQIQNRVPFLEFWQYYQARPPVFKLRVAGIDYLWLHEGPLVATIGRISFGEALVLRAYITDQKIARPGHDFAMTLIWRQTVPASQLVKLQLRDAEGKVWVESAPAPVIDPQGPSPVEGHYLLTLPPDIPRGDYSVWVTVGSSETWAEIITVPVRNTEPTEAIVMPFEANFAHRIALRGFGFNETVRAGETLDLTLHWQTLQPMKFDFTTFIHILDAEGQAVAQSDVQPGHGRWPTTSWLPDEWLTDHVRLALPANIPAGQYRIRVGWYHLETGRRLPLAENEAENSVILNTVTVEAPPNP